MIPTRAKVFVSLVPLVLAALPLWSAAEPMTYNSFTSYSGKGKHPSSGQTGLIIDEDANGSHFACFSYALLTDKRIKGRVSARAELMTPDGSRVIQSVDGAKVESFDFGEPPPSENPCAGEPPTLDVNFGRVTVCTSFEADLRGGDVVRWVFGFKKMSRLKGKVANFQVHGGVIPNPSDG